jgi:2-dehydro-3-deoxyglucarate aldolase/4-hydroxy-2-oxoheptanedioate aldolase
MSLDTFRTFKQRLATDELIRIFCVGRLIHPVLFDIHRMVGGFHGIWIDQEHAGVTYEQIVLASACARGNGLDSFVRLATINYSLVTQCLEAGAGGVMAARVESAAHAEEFLRWAKFAPRGLRGSNTGGYDAHFGGKPLSQFATESNAENFVAIQIETLGALSDARTIAATPDVDLLFLGPADLSQELGIIGQWDHPKLWEAIRHVDDACRRAGKHWATIAATPEFARRCRDTGCRMLSLGMDAVVLRRGVEATKEAFRDLF